MGRGASLNDFARVPVCGLIAHYNDKEFLASDDSRCVTERNYLRMAALLRCRPFIAGLKQYSVKIRPVTMRTASLLPCEARAQG